MISIIVSNKIWHRKYVSEVSARTGHKVIYIDDSSKINMNYLSSIKPRYIFFPHWSDFIPEEVFSNFNCVVFHMSDLPYGRGGSPLQNLISRGIYETKVTALKCTSEIDAGDIYLKKPLSLWGGAEEIYIRSGEIIKEMIVEIINNNIAPIPQKGQVSIFKRRKPSDSNIANLSSLREVFDYIRMLDAVGYPKAYLITDNLKLEFTRAAFYDGFINADVKITPITDKEKENV